MNIIKIHQKLGMLYIGVLIPVLTRRGFPSEPKNGVYSACMCSVTLCENETWLFQDDNPISGENWYNDCYTEV